MAALVLADHDNKRLGSATLNTITAAAALGEGTVAVLVAGESCRGVAEAVARIAGVTKVLLADDARYAQRLAEPMAVLAAGLADGYGHLLAPANIFGKNIAPRIAALLDVAQISDCIAIVSPDTFQRPIYAGNAIVTLRSADPIKVLTVRGTAFPAAEESGGVAAIEPIAAADDPGRSQFVGQNLTKSERPELTAARIIISGGRGMQAGENFALIGAVADRLGAAIGASRAAVDSGFASNDHQVGQTGKVVAPELYIAVGISGAIQHLAGMKDSKVIVAINKDAEAPIFQIADYGLVGDLFKVLPELADELDRQEVKPR